MLVIQDIRGVVVKELRIRRQEKLANMGGRVYPVARQSFRVHARNLFLKLILSREELELVETTAPVKLNTFIYKWNNYDTYKEVLKPYWQRVGVMANTGDTQLFDESFTITTLDHAKYDRVGRFGATSADSQTVMTLDINTELYPCAIGETLHCVLATSLALDGTKDDGKGWRDVGRNVAGAEPNLADMFDYVCHGKIYKFEDGEDGQTM
jgi:DNA-directed RNA polymerase I, II, and III subunit RPABC3